MPAIVLPGRIEDKATEGLSVITYNVTDSALAELKTKYTGLKILDRKSYETVRLAIADLRGKRTAVEDKRKELKSSALEYGRRVDAEAKRITALIHGIEDPLQAEKAKEDDRLEAEKREKALKEQQRIEGIRAKIFAMERSITNAGKTAADIATTYGVLSDTPITTEEYQEFFGEAVKVHAEVIVTLERMYGERLAFEEAQAGQKEEKQRLAVEAKRIEDEKRKLAGQADLEARRTEGVSVEAPAAPLIPSREAAKPDTTTRVAHSPTALLALYAYLNGDALYDAGKKVGMSDEAANFFRSFQEVKISVTVEIETGKVVSWGDFND